jgi:hypothetical protein
MKLVQRLHVHRIRWAERISGRAPSNGQIDAPVIGRLALARKGTSHGDDPRNQQL